MKNYKIIFRVTVVCIAAAFTSCSTLEKASMHGFNSGYYELDSGEMAKKVYIDVTDEKIEVYDQSDNIPGKGHLLSISLMSNDSSLLTPLKFRKQSLDIDITTILLKYRPSEYGLPPQLTSDINFAMYAGWRYDNFNIKSIIDPLGKRSCKIMDVGYDFGVFAGPGTTLISPFTTNNKVSYEYNGMIIQMGIAGFIESNIASFGIGVGFDHLLNRDHKIWIYNGRPWIGLIAGIALH
jgi:hypothetical protein